MKKLVSLKQLSLLIVLAVMPLFAFAGGSAGGGGGGIVCNIQGQTRVLLYDIYDRAPVWKNKLQLSLIKSNEPAQVQLVRAVNRIKNEFMRELVKETLNNIIANHKWLEPGQKFEAGTDFGTQEAPVIPEECDFRPVGYYFAEGFLVINQKFYNAMSETSKAAFFMHEALYFIARDTRYDKDSTEVRKVIAGLFSEDKADFELQKRVNAIFGYGNYSNTIILNAEPLALKLDLSFPYIHKDDSPQLSLKCGKEMYTTEMASFSLTEETIHLNRESFSGSTKFSGKCRRVEVYYRNSLVSNTNVTLKITGGDFQGTYRSDIKGFSSSTYFFLVTRQPTPRLPLN